MKGWELVTPKFPSYAIVTQVLPFLPVLMSVIQILLDWRSKSSTSKHPIKILSPLNPKKAKKSKQRIKKRKKVNLSVVLEWPKQVVRCVKYYKVCSKINGSPLEIMMIFVEHANNDPK